MQLSNRFRIFEISPRSLASASLTERSIKLTTKTAVGVALKSAVFILGLRTSEDAYPKLIALLELLPLRNTRGDNLPSSACDADDTLGGAITRPEPDLRVWRHLQR